MQFTYHQPFNNLSYMNNMNCSTNYFMPPNYNPINNVPNSNNPLSNIQNIHTHRTPTSIPTSNFQTNNISVNN